jgi:hypothetical protein
MRNNALTWAALALFLVSFGGQVATGERVYNAEQTSHHQPTVSLAEYLVTGHFVEATFENWESEFLQMGTYVFLTAFLVQRGSSESKKPKDEEGGEEQEVDEDPREHRNDPGAPWPVRRGGLVLKLYENSLSIAFLSLFLASMLLHAAGGAKEYSAEQAAHVEAGVTLLGYMGTSQFWFESFQNWQSEFLSVISIVLLSIFLRQKGSPESKPVHAPHRSTGSG